jgi:plastocyanin
MPLMLKRGWRFLIVATATLSVPLQAQQRPGGAENPPGKAIAIKNYGFAPKRVVVRQGDVIAWTNSDAVRHDATAIDRSFATGTMKFGETRTVTASKPGTFEYKCSFHPEMRGTIVVEAPEKPPG